MADQADAVWTAILDEMEADLDRDFERSRPWSAPTPTEPMPAHLRDRARRIADAQQRSIATLAEEQSSVSRHLGALRSVPSAQRGDESVYLDVLG